MNLELRRKRLEIQITLISQSNKKVILIKIIKFLFEMIILILEKMIFKITKTHLQIQS